MTLKLVLEDFPREEILEYLKMIQEASELKQKTKCLSDYPPNYQRMAIGLPPVIHHKKPITKEDIDKSAWIPVTEKPAPEEGGTYLVTVHNEKRFKSGYGSVSAYYNKRDNKWVPDDEWITGEVVAWMPVPEPYKPESEEKKE